MKLNALIILLVIAFGQANGQLKTTKIDGGSVVLKLGFGISVNENSTLKRDFILINDESCPLTLDNVGVVPNFVQNSYTFKATGSVFAKELITAYELHHVLYDVFGKHIKTLSLTDVTDANGIKVLDKFSWRAYENQVSQYLICVSYVAAVRSASGGIWRYDIGRIKEELQKIELEYDSTYAPPRTDERK